ncbi:MAG: hypothetical protein H0W13_10265 [Nitrospirales bacterium]|nr:hypothetical protein [Nitrospirales bacterium]
MNAEDKSHLDAIMSSFEQKLAKSKDARTQRQSEEDAGYAEFKRVQTDVIRPAMEDMANELKARGHESQISEVGDERSKRDVRITMTITIGGVPATGFSAESAVSVSFSRTGSTTVSIQAMTPIKSRSGLTSQRGNYAASEITTGMVQKKILEVLEEVFSTR